MDVDWRIGLKAVLAFWILGWLLTGSLYILWNVLWPGRQKVIKSRFPFARKSTDSVITVLVGAVLMFGFWPFTARSLWEGVKFYYAIRRGKIPAWRIYSDEEQTSRTWRLSDGTEFFASAFGGTSFQNSRIHGDYQMDNMTGVVEYRIQRIAPTPLHKTAEWHRLELHSSEDHGADEVGDNEPRYHAELRLKCGKYTVEFRVQNHSGTFEECSGVTMIVDD